MRNIPVWLPGRRRQNAIQRSSKYATPAPSCHSGRLQEIGEIVMDSHPIMELFVRSSTSTGHDDHAGSGSGALTAAGHDDHSVHSHPGTVLFLFVTIAVGGEQLFKKLIVY